MRISANYKGRIIEADVPFELDLDAIIARIGDTQTLACLEYAISNKAQQEMRRLMRLGRDDEFIRERLKTWTPFPRANRSLAQRFLKEAMNDD